MAVNNELGKLGEELGLAWLQQNGFSILHQNWRHSHYELDLIAWKGDTVHVVEVKLRTSTTFGMPEEAVNKKKYRDLMKAADRFLSLNPQYRYLQLDILSITQSPKGGWAYFMIEDVFFT